jgi:hypothetical protein
MKHRRCQKKGCKRKQKELRDCDGILLCTNHYKEAMNNKHDWCKVLKDVKKHPLVR